MKPQNFVFYLIVIPWLIGYWISTTTKEVFLFAGQKFRFDWCSWNFFCPSTQNGNVWDIRDKIYLWIIFFREPQTKDISPAETKKNIKVNHGALPEENGIEGVLPWVDCFKDWSKGTYLILSIFFVNHHYSIISLQKCCLMYSWYNLKTPKFSQPRGVSESLWTLLETKFCFPSSLSYWVTMATNQSFYYNH